MPAVPHELIDGGDSGLLPNEPLGADFGGRRVPAGAGVAAREVVFPVLGVQRHTPIHTLN
jgi:hypothetical protein